MGRDADGHVHMKIERKIEGMMAKGDEQTCGGFEGI
jgi:hypothetical protein